MSNDSNERGHDTAGDAMMTCDQCGNMGYATSWPFVAMRRFMDGRDQADAVLCEDCWRDAEPHLSATPAPAPAQTAPDEPDMPPSLTMGYDDRDGQDDDDDPDGDEDWDDDATEPATPAPAATPPALDLGRLEYNIRLASQAIHDAGALSTDQTENIVCVALNQIDVALHTLYDAVRALAAQQQSGK